jgi:NAD+ synthase (glutamine-hydrolysing)
VRIALAQINPTVGDIQGNAALVASWTAEARAAGADLVVFPELAVCGYPPEDLVLKDHFVAGCREALAKVAEACLDVVALVGLPLAEDGRTYNAAAILAGGSIRGFYRKILLPNYAVFDEKRYFASGDQAVVLSAGGLRLGVTICEDIWEDDGPGESSAVLGGAGIIINLSMSPYHRGKGDERKTMLAERAKAAGAYVLYVNGVGGQDELVFDGQSVALGPDGSLLARACQFDEELLVVDLALEPSAVQADVARAASPRRSWPVEVLEVPVGPERPVSAGPAPARVCEPLLP